MELFHGHTIDFFIFFLAVVHGRIDYIVITVPFNQRYTLIDMESDFDSVSFDTIVSTQFNWLL